MINGLFPVLESVGRDIKYAVRGMRRTPVFTIVALATLALAIGANTAIFSVGYGLLVRPLAYRDADRLVVIEATRQYEGTPRPGRVSWPLDAAARWQEWLHVFSDVTFYSDQVFQRSSPNGSQLLEGATVSPSFFAVAGGPMLAGRPIANADAPTPSVVISDRLAQRLFNGAGVAIGLPAAYAASRAFAALLFGVKTTDIFTYVASASALIGVAMVASYAPARRAVRVDPIVALRAE
jgi:putative ABC transport system permease protein